MKLQVYRSRRLGGRTEWRWRVRASNGRILATGAEGYTKRWRCIRMAERVMLTTFRKYITREIEK